MSALLLDQKSPVLEIRSPEDEDGFMNILVEMKDDAIIINPASERNHYHEEWQMHFEVDDYITRLRSLGQRGKLRSSSFRSICWKLYLECLPEQQSDWIKVTWANRQKYRDFQEKLSTNPRLSGESFDLTFNNPLSQETQSPWNKFFQDGELKLTIRQDVIRTFPEVKFFHTPAVQSMMVNILFSYGREFPEISYRQGMHELLAPIIFVLHADQQAFLHASDNDLVSQEIREIMDPEFTEHDAYFLFSKVMDLVQSWYVMGENKHHKMEHLKLAPFSQPPEFGPNSYIEVKLTKIHNLLLRQHDPELHNHLKNLEIAPQIYGIRWLRLLFGREFSLPDLLVVWDAIFANGTSFDLVDHIFCAMLMFIRDLLLGGDYANCLNYLMRYPSNSDANYVLDLALHLKDPLTHSRPSGHSSHMQDVGLSKIKNCYQPSIQNLNHTDNAKCVKNSSILRPNTLTLASSATKTQAEVQVANELQTLESKSDSPEQVSDNVFRRLIRRPSFNDHTAGKPRSAFKQHQRHQSDDLERIVHRDVVQLGNKESSRKTKNGSDLRRTELSQSMSQLDNRKAAASNPVCKEMVPLRPCNSSSVALGSRNSLFRSSRSRSHDKEEELRVLRMDVSQLRAMKDYCWSRMTRHLDRIQDVLVKQELQNEDELYLALAGLKRVRDILKGTLTFSEEVISDEEFRDGYSNLHINSDDECGWQLVTCNGEQGPTPGAHEDKSQSGSGLDSAKKEFQKLISGLTGDSKTKCTK